MLSGVLIQCETGLLGVLPCFFGGSQKVIVSRFAQDAHMLTESLNRAAVLGGVGLVVCRKAQLLAASFSLRSCSDCHFLSWYKYS